MISSDMWNPQSVLHQHPGSRITAERFVLRLGLVAEVVLFETLPHPKPKQS